MFCSSRSNGFDGTWRRGDVNRPKSSGHLLSRFLFWRTSYFIALIAVLVRRYWMRLNSLGLT